MTEPIELWRFQAPVKLVFTVEQLYEAQDRLSKYHGDARHRIDAVMNCRAVQYHDVEFSLLSDGSLRLHPRGDVSESRDPSDSPPTA